MTNGETGAVKKLQIAIEAGEVVICVRDDDGRLNPIAIVTAEDVAYWRRVVQVFQGVDTLKIIGGVAKQMMIAVAGMTAVVMWLSGKIRLSELLGLLK